MDTYYLDQFSENLAKLSNYLAELAGIESYIAAFGWASVSRLENASKTLEIVEAFNEFLPKLQRISRKLDRHSDQQLTQFLEKADLQRKLTKVSTKIKVGLNTRQPSSASFTAIIGFTANSILGKFGTQNSAFTKAAIDLEELISDIDILKGKVREMRELFIDRVISESETFKPENINEDEVQAHLERAIELLEAEGDMPEALRKQLLANLRAAHADAAKPRPPWPSIIGTLVIVSTILSGLADTPQAYSNVKQSLDHIMGGPFPSKRIQNSSQSNSFHQLESRRSKKFQSLSL